MINIQAELNKQKWKAGKYTGQMSASVMCRQMFDLGEQPVKTIQFFLDSKVGDEIKILGRTYYREL